MKIYQLHGLLDSWKIISEEIKARTDKEAKSKLRRRYRGIQGIHIVGIRDSK